MDEPCLVESADDSSSDTSSLYEAEVVCGISQKQGKTPKEQSGESRRSKTLAERVGIHRMHAAKQVGLQVMRDVCI